MLYRYPVSIRSAARGRGEYPAVAELHPPRCVSIRSAARGRGECHVKTTPSKAKSFNPLRGARPRRIRRRRLAGFVPGFQSAPRREAAENVAKAGNNVQEICFNPLRGARPRRIVEVCIDWSCRRVSIRSAARGRGECHYQRKSNGQQWVSIRSAARGRGEYQGSLDIRPAAMFQSAPRREAAENGRNLTTRHDRQSFNPLRGARPRRMNINTLAFRIF